MVPLEQLMVFKSSVNLKRGGREGGRGLVLHRFPAGSGICTEYTILSRMFPLELPAYMQQGFRQNIQCCVKMLMGIGGYFFSRCRGIIITLH